MMSMIDRLFKFKRNKSAPMAKRKNIGTDIPKNRIPELDLRPTESELLATAAGKTFQKPQPFPVGVAKDDSGDCLVPDNLGCGQNAFNGSVVPGDLAVWYASQSFIGHQLAATFAQHWLISKCCLMPAKDATRNGFEISLDTEVEGSAEILDAIRRADVKFKLNENLIEFVQMGRVFGIRVALFLVDADDPATYYANPFNPDSIKPGTYRGITQIDPYWLAPQMSDAAASDPADKNFYEPTWWIINGRPTHRTHLVIYRTEQVADILKPTYLYGGIPIPQKIYERVYAAERIANEAPALAMSKRLTTYKMNTSLIANKPSKFLKQMQTLVYCRDNFGVKVMGPDEEMNQFDTSLADLDDLIMTQYQIVAAAANVPAVKLLGTTPKGFQSTGEFEEANYHEELESIQSHDLTPLIQRHHLMLIRSEIAPEFNLQPFTTTITWNSLDAMTAREQVELNKIKAETGQILMANGAIDSDDERERLINDKESGYVGLVNDSPEDYELGDDPEMLLQDPTISSSSIGA